MAPRVPVDVPASRQPTVAVVGCHPNVGHLPLAASHRAHRLGHLALAAALTALLLPVTMAGTQVATLDTGLTVTIHYEAKEDVLVHW